MPLCVKDAVLECNQIVHILAIGRKIVGHFNHSVLALQHLKTCQAQHGLKENLLVQDCPTRWNSSYLMLQSLVDNEVAISTYSSRYATDNFLTLTHQEWRIAKKISKVLEKFHSLTLEFSKKTANIGCVIPGLFQIEVSLLFKQIRDYFQQLFRNFCLLELMIGVYVVSNKSYWTVLSIGLVK